MKYEVLNSLRGISAILIAIGHYFYFTGNGDKYPISFILGVDFFFILSGLVLYNSLMKNNDDKIDKYVGKLIKGRFFRLYIPYAILGIIFCIIHGLPNLYTLTVIFTLTQNLGFSPGGYYLGETIFGISWALSLEFWIGTIFMTIMFKLKKNKFKTKYVLMILIWLCLFIIVKNSPLYLNVHYHEVNRIPLGIFRIILGYSVGVMIYFFSERIKNSNIITKNKNFYTILEIGIIIFIIIIYGKTNYNKMNDFLFFLYGGMGVLIFSIENGLISKLLKTNIFKFMGKISFSIYLVHPFIIDIFRDKILNIYNLLIYLVVVIIVSILNFYFIENIGLKLKKSLRTT